jgi:hypothetical protein
MRRFCSWGRRAAHSHPILTLAVASACALATLQGCSRGTSGRSLLSRLSRSDSDDVEIGTSSLTDDDETVAVGGLSQGTRRDATESSRSEQVAAESEQQPTRTGPPSTDPWLRQQAPTIPDDGRPVASGGSQTTGSRHGSASVEEWLERLDSAPRGGTSTGTARLDSLASREPTQNRTEAAGEATLASSQQPGTRPAWADQDLPERSVSNTRVTEDSSWDADHSAPAVSQSGPEPQPRTTAESSRRVDALLQVDALLTRAHDLEVQGKPHEAYRFALVAHQIVQQERLVLPPGQERPIDYLDALSAASDTVEHDSSWDHRADESRNVYGDRASPETKRQQST